MFILSQLILNISGTYKTQQILSYSIILGLIIYSSIYLYFLFYNNEYLNIFNKFLIYIVMIDLLLSAFYYFNLGDHDENDESDETEASNESDDESDNYIETDGDADDEADDETDVEIDGETDVETDYEADDESQEYIKQLINNAKLSEQERISEFMHNTLPQLNEEEQEELVDVNQEELVDVNQEELVDVNQEELVDVKHEELLQNELLKLEEIKDEVMEMKKRTKRNKKKIQ